MSQEVKWLAAEAVTLAEAVRREATSKQHPAGVRSELWLGYDLLRRATDMLQRISRKS